MKKKTQVILSSGVALSILGTMPISVEAKKTITEKVAGSLINPKDDVAKSSDSIQPSRFSEFEAQIVPSSDPNRAKFFEKIKKYDPDAGNKLYLTDENGFEEWTPLRPRTEDKGGISTLEYSYENIATMKKADKNSTDKAWLKRMWQGDSDVTHNFKIRKTRFNKLLTPTTYADMKQDGKIVEKSEDINDGGYFDNKSGTWRYGGYNTDGSALEDPLFPADYTRAKLSLTYWEPLGKYDKYFSPGRFDAKRYKAAKRNLITRLRKQEPQMQYKSVDQWMNILSLRSESVENPKTRKKDGNYGGANFMAHNSGKSNINKGQYYSSFALLGEKSHGTRNLNLEKLVITESTKNKNGIYPVVAEFTRSKAQTRQTKNAKVYKKVKPGKTYRVVSTVRNMNNLKATQYKPTTVQVGLLKNYASNKKTNIELDGIYNNKVNTTKVVGTQKGNIAPGKSVNVVTEIKVPSNAIAKSNVRIGTVIDPNHRKKGDNLNEVDDDLMRVLKVDNSGNVAALAPVLIGTDGKEVANPIPGNKYKIRYKFKYTGANQTKKTKMTVDYAILRKLPGKTEEMITTQEGKKDKDVSSSKSIILKNNQTYSIDTKSFQWYEFPYVATEGILKTDSTSLNSNINDDVYSKTWGPTYDYAVSDLQVIPRTERDLPTADNKKHYGVVFNVNKKTPTNVTSTK